jgi:hypothetical protein
MSRVLKRPMFKMGGSTSGGITSGLKRTGYDNGGLTTEERLMRAVGPPRKNVYDFLIDFGLNIASMPPQGNIISTAAAAAKEPFGRFTEASRGEENLRRQVGLEAAGIDIRAEQAKAAALAEANLKKELQKNKFKHEKELYEIETGANTQKLIEAEVELLVGPDGIYNEISPAENHANWKYVESKKYDASKIGGVLTMKNLTDKKFAKNQGKKNGVGRIFYDPFNDRVLEITRNLEGDYVLSPVAGSEEASKGVSITTRTGDATGAELIGEKENTKIVGTDVVADRISPSDLGIVNKPVFESISEIKEIIKFPMSGKEIKEQYEIAFPINEKTIFYPKKNRE